MWVLFGQSHCKIHTSRSTKIGCGLMYTAVEPSRGYPKSIQVRERLLASNILFSTSVGYRKLYNPLAAVGWIN